VPAAGDVFFAVLLIEFGDGLGCEDWVAVGGADDAFVFGAWGAFDP
jgi:hypothetical protein